MEPEKKSNGAFVGLVIIIIILIAGGIYIWQTNKKTLEEAPNQNISSEDSAELNSLEAELESADTETGVDVNAIN